MSWQCWSSWKSQQLLTVGKKICITTTTKKKRVCVRVCVLQLATADKVDLSQLGNVPDMSDMSSCVHPSLSLFISLSHSAALLPALWVWHLHFSSCKTGACCWATTTTTATTEEDSLPYSAQLWAGVCVRVWTFRQVRKIGICNIIHKFAQRNIIHVSHVGNSCRTLASVRDSSLGSKVNLNTSKVVTF